jgi:hypothetical protein
LRVNGEHQPIDYDLSARVKHASLPTPRRPPNRMTLKWGRFFAVVLPDVRLIAIGESARSQSRAPASRPERIN